MFSGQRFTISQCFCLSMLFALSDNFVYHNFASQCWSSSWIYQIKFTNKQTVWGKFCYLHGCRQIKKVALFLTPTRGWKTFLFGLDLFEKMLKFCILKKPIPNFITMMILKVNFWLLHGQILSWLINPEILMKNSNTV